MSYRTRFAILLECLVAWNGQFCTPVAAERQVYDSDHVAGISRVVKVSKAALVHTNQIFPLARSGDSVVETDPAAQVNRVFDNLKAALKLGKSDLASVVKLNIYVTNAGVIEPFRKALANEFPMNPPAVTFVTTALPVPQAQLALDAVAISHSPDIKDVVRLGDATAIGSRFGSAVSILPIGPRVYISGQAEKGDGTLADATRLTLNSLLNSLRFVNLDRSHIVQLKAFVTPMSDMLTVERETRTFFDGHIVPPLIGVEWKSTLPIEIELIAASPPSLNDPSNVEYLAPPQLKHSPVFSRIARVNHPTSIYVSGLLADGVDQSADQEVRELLVELRRAVERAGSDLRHLVKATYYVTDDLSSNGLNKLRPEFYDPERPPTASKAFVQGVGLLGHRITLDMIAVPRE